VSNPDTPLDAPITALSSIERGRLARVIHDDVMQSLAACVLAADLSDRYCREGRLDDARLELGAIREGMDLAITALRDLLIDLRVPA
jgi:signal transduction histidine kinase